MKNNFKKFGLIALCLCILYGFFITIEYVRFKTGNIRPLVTLKTEKSINKNGVNSVKYIGLGYTFEENIYLYPPNENGIIKANIKDTLSILNILDFTMEVS